MNKILFQLLFFLTTGFMSTLFTGDLSTEESVVIGSIMDAGTKWSLIRQTDGISGALFVQRERKGESQIVAGDSSPFPLSNYGISPQIARQLAELFVDHEIKTNPGGLAAVRQQVLDREKLPHDLLEAYSRYIEVTARPVYGTNRRDLNDMLSALRSVAAARGKNQAQDRILKKLNPLLSEMLTRVADDPQENLGMAVLQATTVHPNSSSLQELSAVFAGRQAETFLKSLGQMDPNQKKRVLQALEGAVESGLVGGVVKRSVQKLFQSATDQ